MMQPELTGARRIIHEHTLATAQKIAERRAELRQLEADAQKLTQAAQLLDGTTKPLPTHKAKATVVNISDFAGVRVAEEGRSPAAVLKKLPRQFTPMDVDQIVAWDKKRIYNQITNWKARALIMPISRGVYRKV